MKSRFNFFDNPDSEFLKHANRLKLDMLVGEDGEVWMSYEIHGGVCAGGDDEDASRESGGTCCKEEPDPVELAVNLLAEFVAAKTEGGAK